ncbi:MAG: dockerin type I repeat-containing protein [Ruminococcus flavefaciens]|nr:dockerin type I repeat-containing protein [Ruminococcus flavefaciens]
MNKKLKAFAVAVMAVVSTVGVTAVNTSAETSESSAYHASGDVNSSGTFTIADVLVFQKWLTGNGGVLNNWRAGDFTGDGVLDIFDLCLMKSALQEYNQKTGYPSIDTDVIDEFVPCTADMTDFFDNSGISVVIKHQYSVSDRIWTIGDFKGVENIKSIAQQDNYNPTSSLKQPYRQIISIELDECSCENVLKMVKQIEALNIPEIMEVKVRMYGTGLLPMTREEWDRYFIIEENSDN